MIDCAEFTFIHKRIYELISLKEHLKKINVKAILTYLRKT